MPQRWCADCGQLFDKAATGTQRCPGCQAQADQARRARGRVYDNTIRQRPGPRERGYDAAYDRARRQLLAAARVCHWCGNPFTPADPATADHLTPVSQGGRAADRMVAAHRSCNSRRGGQMRKRRR